MQYNFFFNGRLLSQKHPRGMLPPSGMKRKLISSSQGFSTGPGTASEVGTLVAGGAGVEVGVTGTTEEGILSEMGKTVGRGVSAGAGVADSTGATIGLFETTGAEAAGTTGATVGLFVKTGAGVAGTMGAGVGAFVTIGEEVSGVTGTGLGVSVEAVGPEESIELRKYPE